MEQVAWYVGIDWGSERHAVCLIDSTGRHREERSIVHTVAAVQACLDWVLTSAGVMPREIAVAIETPRGALVDACLARGFLVFAVNPKQLDRFRDRHTMAGAKDDRRDAYDLAPALDSGHKLGCGAAARQLQCQVRSLFDSATHGFPPATLYGLFRIPPERAARVRLLVW
jgi:hypothetical protein